MSLGSSSTSCSFLLVLVTWLLICSVGTSAESCNPEDKRVLLQIKKELGNPSFLSSWVPSSDCCSPKWYRIFCDTATDTPRVNDLDLSRLKLPFLLPSPTSLISMHSSSTEPQTNVFGPIPDSLSSLPNLTQINFNGNRLSGNIPPSFSNLNLAFVDLSRNLLEGDASVLFGAEKETQNIILAKNLFAFDLGKVGLSKNLETLDLRNNRIYGMLPKGLTALKYLQNLNVSFNNLNVSLCGEIPKGGNLQRFRESSYVHNKCFCGSPLPTCN